MNYIAGSDRDEALLLPQVLDDHIAPLHPNEGNRGRFLIMATFGRISSGHPLPPGWEIRSIPGISRPEQKSLLGRFAEHTKSVIDLS